METWFYVQYSVDSFTDRCTKLARRLANFITIIQQEDISLLDNYDEMREVIINIRRLRCRLCQMKILSNMPILAMVSEKHNPIKTFALYYCLRDHEALIYLQAKNR